MSVADAEPADSGAAVEEAQEREGSSALTVEDIEAGNIQEMARDKAKSRLLQRSLLRGSPEVSKLILQKTLPLFMDLVRDQYGNYLSQKILEVVSAEQFAALFETLRGQLGELAQDVHGTRAVQKLVEQAISRGLVSELLEALPIDLVEGLARSVTGFHVAARLVELLPSKEAEELLDRLCGTPERALSLGMDQWGCCVLKKCLDRAARLGEDCSDGSPRQRLVDAVLANALALVQDPFGNYVVQHLLLMGHSRQSPGPALTRIIDALRGHIFELSQQKFSSNVLEKCLVGASERDRDKIINEILSPPDRLPSEAVRLLLFHQYGNYVLQQALEVAREPQFSILVQLAKQHVQDAVRSAAAPASSESPDMPAADTPNDAPTADAESDATGAAVVQAAAPAVAAGGASSQPAGALSAEHARRLALKLAKKYPAFAEGLESELGSPVPGAWGPYYDSYFDPYSFDAYSTWMGGAAPPSAFPPLWDASFGAVSPVAYPPARLPGGGAGGCAGSAAGSARQSSKSRRTSPRRTSPRAERSVGAGRPAVDAGAGASPQTVRVGRIVGFWPNYTVTYDEVPVPGAAVAGGASKRGSRSKNQQKGRPAHRRPAGGTHPVEA